MGIEAELSLQEVAVDPGTIKNVDFSVRNTGSQACEVVTTVPSEVREWMVTIPHSVNIEPGEQTVVSVCFKPPCGPVPNAGTHQFVVDATCSEGSTTVSGKVQVKPFTEVIAAMEPVVAHDQHGSVFTVKLENRGNVGMEATLSADEPSNELDLTLSTVEVSAGPGDTATATLQVQARKKLKKGERRFPICVRAQVRGGPPLRADGAFYQQGKRA